MTTAFPAEEAAAIRYIFCDIDDTLTLEGRLLSEAYQALWAAFDAGFYVIPVTGRPAGWVDHIARMWPVHAVIGENGGFYAWMTAQGMKTRFVQKPEERREGRKKLEGLKETILREVPGCALASDQNYREIDLAIDFCEDVPPLSEADVRRIVAIFEQAGAHAKVSSIHVNGWFGTFDKLTTCRLLASELLGIDDDTLRRTSVFCGDSPNDEPMFSFFPRSIGVANVRRFLPQMRSWPTYITEGQGGYGFAEVVRFLLRHRLEGSASPPPQGF